MADIDYINETKDIGEMEKGTLETSQTSHLWIAASQIHTHSHTCHTHIHLCFRLSCLLQFHKDKNVEVPDRALIIIIIISRAWTRHFIVIHSFTYPKIENASLETAEVAFPSRQRHHSNDCLDSVTSEKSYFDHQQNLTASLFLRSIW